MRKDTRRFVAALGAEAARRVRKRAVLVGAVGKELACCRRRCGRHRFGAWLGRLGVLIVACRVLAEHAKLARNAARTKNWCTVLTR